MKTSKIALPAVSLAVALCIGLSAPVLAAEALTKDQVNAMIHDYIMSNPQVIEQSMNDYQKKQQEDRAAQAATDPASPVAGNPKGDVTVVEFFDYNCHFCKGALPAVQGMIDKDKKVRVVFKEFPILAQSSETAAQWALAANKQHKYFEFHKAMMNNKERIDDELLEKVAKSVGMNVEQAKKDAASPEVADELAKTRALADQLQISGTPAFIIGGNINRGAIPEEEMEKQVAATRAAKQ